MKLHHRQVIRVWIEAIGLGVAGDKTVRRLKAAMRLAAGKDTRAITISAWHWKATLRLESDHLLVVPLRSAIVGELEAV